MLSVALVAILFGCTTTADRSASAVAPVPPAAPAPVRTESVAQGRMLVWRAWLSLEVSNVHDALSRVTDIAKQSGGYIENKSESGESEAHAILRVPADSLAPVITSLESVGKVTSRSVSSEGVTEQYLDLDARMKTMIALRDRLRALLDKARDIKDILAIEKELGRVQADIDSMQARLKALKGMVDLSSLDVSIERKRILGPLGYVFKGIWWAVEKLFVIQK